MARSRSLLWRRLEELNVTQVAVAHVLQMSRARMSRIVRGRRLPNLLDAQRIAHCLHSTVEELWPLANVNAHPIIDTDQPPFLLRSLEDARPEDRTNEEAATPESDPGNGDESS